MLTEVEQRFLAQILRGDPLDLQRYPYEVRSICRKLGIEEPSWLASFPVTGDGLIHQR